MFNFFFKSYKCGLLTFGGENVEVEFDLNGFDCKETIKNYENGVLKDKFGNTKISTRHPNIVKGVIMGKKSWGLHIKMWSEGIRDWCFTKEEILKDFTDRGIVIPKSMLLDFDNWIEKYKQERYK